MKVLPADSYGFCFGIRDALAATERISQPQLVTIHGELVHNEAVLHALDARGFHRQPETARESLPDSPQILITAHGISNGERRRLQAHGKQLLDTTCPLVRRAHQAAQTLAAEGRHVIVIGRSGHVEVRGLVGDLADYSIVEDESDIRTWPHDRLGIVCQTTTPPALASRLQQAVRDQNPHADVRYLNTICQPTIDRQLAVERLLPQVDAVVVVGGRNSNNTAQLANLCRAQGVPAYHVQGAEDLEYGWFTGCEVVGLTAGTSTPDAVIDEVAAALRRLTPTARRTGEPLTSGEWCRHFLRNARNRPPIAWETVAALTAEERAAVGRSMAVFQLGESGAGTHLLRCARRHSEKTGDPNYLPAVAAFVREEQRHAALLGRFLDAAGLPRLTHSWTDGVFRWLRHRAGLELTITVLVTAEILANVYYAALRDATRCTALRALCRQILHDEVAHVRFQRERITRLRAENSRWLRGTKRLLHVALYAVTAVVLWATHRTVFRAADIGFRRYWQRSWREFRRGAGRRISKVSTARAAEQAEISVGGERRAGSR